MTVSVQRRKQLLQGIPGFRDVSAKLLNDLADSLHEEHYPLGAVIVAEGEIGDRLFLIESGEAEVTTPGATAAVSLALLSAGDMFGELALLSPTRRREATVTALTPVVTLSLSADAFERVVEGYPEVRVDFAILSQTLLTDKFLKQQASWRM